METKIRRANALGLEHRETGEYACYYTPVLQRAYDLGHKGLSLVGQPVVTGYRYGKAPESYISHNYSEDRPEYGLSLAALAGQPECGSVIWFAGRDKHEYTGILSPVKGSDDEPVILCTTAEYWD